MFLLNTVLLLAHATFVSGLSFGTTTDAAARLWMTAGWDRMGIHNRALGKPTKSSTLTNNKGRAVDGNRESNFLQNSCWESQIGDMQPYWMVDLQSFFLLDYITITNRGDCCGDRMHDLKIEVFADDPVLEPSTPSQLCTMYDGPMPGGATENISCSCAAHGRYIRIRGLDRRYATDLLTLCEVEVYERTPTGCFSTDLHRLVGTKYVGNVIPVDVASAADCSTYCIYNRTCIGFNYNYNTHGCELRVGPAEASSAIGWFYFFKRHVC